jgi:ferric-dicitrate binding protein FerR (iron transport regulator)
MHNKTGVFNYQLKFIVKQAEGTSGDERYDADEGWEKVKEKRAGRRRTMRRRVMRRFAAAIVLVAGTVSYLYYLDGQVGQEEGETGRVTLILANGERVTWEEEQQQVRDREWGVSITRDEGGRMRYQVEETGATGEEEYNQLIVPRGSELPVQLPDGSVVWLNSASSLRFPVRFAGSERKVYLEGEGFFEVTGDAGRPFRVISGEKVVTVVGTRFNVSAYADDPTWHVTLAEGRVSVSIDGAERALEPSEQLLYNKVSGTSTVSRVEADTYTAWTRGQIYFKLSPLEEIVKKLERWYDFTIAYEGEGIEQVRFRGGINKYRPLEETLRYLEETGKVRFTVRGKSVSVTHAKGARE